MKVIIQASECALRGECVMAAPEVFEIEDDKDVVTVTRQAPCANEPGRTAGSPRWSTATPLYRPQTAADSVKSGLVAAVTLVLCGCGNSCDMRAQALFRRQLHGSSK
jgi:hypothetical protein